MEKYLRISMLVLGIFLVGSAIQAITKNRIAYYKQLEVVTQQLEKRGVMTLNFQSTAVFNIFWTAGV